MYKYLVHCKQSLSIMFAIIAASSINKKTQ